MKARELLAEKSLRFGKREMMKALQDSELFTYGFEAEFILDVDTMENAPEVRTTHLADIDNLRDLVDAAELNQRDEMRLDRQFDDWREDRAGEMADAELEDEMNEKAWDEFKDEWDEVYTDKRESINEEMYIEDQGVEEILRELDPETEWEIVGNGKYLEVKLYPELEGDESIDFLAKHIENNFPYEVQAEGSQPDKFNLTWDTSVKPDDDDSDDKGVELVSPVFDSYEEFKNGLDEAFTMISNLGYTNNTTGLHINIGPKNKSMTIDPLKLSLLIGDEYVGRMFGREMNQYAETAKQYIKSSMHRMDINELSTSQEVMKELEKLLGDDEKYKAVNVKKLKNQGYLEFRITGGTDYQRKFDKILDTALRYVYVLTVAANPYIGRQEYLSELGRLAYEIMPRRTADTKNYKKIANLFRNAGVPTFEYEQYRMSKEKTYQEKLHKLVTLLVRISNKGTDQIPKAMVYWVQKEVQRLGVQPNDVSNELLRLVSHPVSSLNKDRVVDVLRQLNFPTGNAS